MKRTRWLGCGAVLLTLVLAAGATAQDKSPLAELPANTSVVVHLRGLERTKDRLLVMLQNAVPDLAPRIKEQLDRALDPDREGRKLKGLERDGSIFFVVADLAQLNQQRPPLAALFRVKNFGDFRDGLLTEDERKTLTPDPAGFEVVKHAGDFETYWLERDGLAAVTSNKELAASLAKKPQRGLDATLDRELARRLLAADLGFYVDLAAVNKQFGPQIKQARQMLDLAVEQAAQGEKDKSDRASMEMIKVVAGGLLQAVEDGQSFIKTLDFRPQGLAVHAGFRVADNSPSSAALKGAKPSPLAEIANLPGGQSAYTALLADSSLLKSFVAATQGVFADPETDEGKALRKVLDQVEAAGPELQLYSLTLPVNGIYVYRYADPAKAAAGRLALFKTLKAGGAFYQVPLLEKPALKADAQDHRGYKLNEVHLRWDLEKVAENPLGGKFTAETTKKLLGDRLNVWFGTDGKHYVELFAKDWPQAQRLLDRYLDGQDKLGDQPLYQEVRKQLPETASMLSLIDLPRYYQVFLGAIMPAVAEQLGKDAEKFPDLDKVKLKPSYAGLTLKLEGRHAGFDAWVPITTVREMRKLVDPLVKAFNAAQKE